MSTAHSRTQLAIAVLAVVAIVLHLVLQLRESFLDSWINSPLDVALTLGGVPLVWALFVN